MNIHIKGTKEQFKNNFICNTDQIIPPMYNGGWGDFHFTESINFTFEDMPLIPKKLGGYGGMAEFEHETENYKYFDAPIMLIDPNGRKITGNYYITLDKNTNTFISESVSFS